jgi:tetratricopeptide (TPR) repeat protein
MAKKHKHKKRSATKPVTPVSVTPQALEEQANKQLLHGFFKDTINSLKRLLRIQDKPEWRSMLAIAYAGRCRQLAAQGMRKEAAELWHIMVDATNERLEIQHYIGWLIKLDRFEAAQQACEQYRAEMDRAALTYIDEIWAMTALAGNTTALKILDNDDVVISHFQPASNALAAYCDGDDEMAANQLKLLPFRSPYRNFRWLLSALLCVNDNQIQCSELLAKIPVDSAFATVVPVVQALLSQPVNVTALSSRQADFVQAIQGVDKQLVSWLGKLEKAGAEPKQLFQAVSIEAKKNANPELQQTARALLVHYPAGIKAYQKQFETLSALEKARYQALHCETQHDLMTAIPHWFDVLNYYELFADKVVEADLSAALVMRHIAELYEKIYGVESSKIGSILELSLTNDPYDHDSWIKLCEHYEKSDNSKQRDDCIERALKQLPNDPVFLQYAVESAIARGAFKKGVKLANTLLKIDPINQKVSAQLVKAHLAHARKQIRAKKFELADKELAAAHKVARTPIDQALVCIDIGLLGGESNIAGKPALLAVMLGQSEQDLPSQLDKARKLLQPVLAETLIAIEATRLGLPAKHCQSTLSSLKKLIKSTPSPTKETLFAILHPLCELAGEADAQIKAPLTALTPYLKQGISLNWSIEELEALGELLIKLDQFKLIQAYLRRLPKLLQVIPAIVFLSVRAKCSNQPAKLSQTELFRLEDAVEDAQSNNEVQLANRMMRFLDDYDNAVYGDGSEDEFNPQMLNQIMGDAARELGISPEEFAERILSGLPDEELPMEFLPDSRRKQQ